MLQLSASVPLLVCILVGATHHFFSLTNIILKIILCLRLAKGALSRYQAGKIAADFISSDPKRLGKLAGWVRC